MQALNAFAAPLVEEPPELVDGLLLHAAAMVVTATRAIVTENALRKGVSFGLFSVSGRRMTAIGSARDSTWPSHPSGRPSGPRFPIRDRSVV
jgi:hypothetical protein